MQKPLDPLGFKQSRYEHPNQDWICGRAAEGLACPLGPDKHGSCRASGQCIPTRKGDRWFCTRSEAAGGKCDEGPLPRGECSHPISPCQPIRSLRRLREVTVWMVVALTIGSLLLLFGDSFWRSWVNPGELNIAHANSAAKCSDCHSLDRGRHGSIAAIISPRERDADSALCLKCHSLGDHPLNPHGVAPASLIALDRKLRKNAGSTNGPVLVGLSRTISGLNTHSEGIACMTCHQEHHGRNFDLKRLSNAQCQTCHSVQFRSLQSGHPEFSDYPYRRRTRIMFDHNAHLHDYFTVMTEDAPGSCQDCHVVDPTGRFMGLKNFNVTCAACHEPQIRGEGPAAKGVAFFSLPGLDVQTLAAKGISIGEWPKSAEEKITPFMELLLRRGPATREALETLHGIDLRDLSKATPAQLAAAQQLAWGIKSLLYDFVVEGQSFLIEQMRSQLSSAREPVLSGLTGEMPRAVLLAAQKDWMPNLLTEVANYRKSIKSPLPERVKPAAATSHRESTGGDESIPGGGHLVSASGLTSSGLLAPSGGKSAAVPTATPSAAGTIPSVEPKQGEEWAAAGGWYRSEKEFTIFYRPSGHADVFFMAWLTAAAQMNRNLDSSEARDIFRKLADPDSLGICMKCHTADKSGNSMMVNWLPAQPQPHLHAFTTFKHTSHFSLVGDKGCETCHMLNANSEYPKFFTGDAGSEANRDPNRFQSNFKPLLKAMCIECHKPKIAGDACLMCHEYHTGSFAAKVGTRKMGSDLVKTQ